MGLISKPGAASTPPQASFDASTTIYGADTLYLNSFSLNKDSYRYTAAPYAANAVVD